MENEHFELYKKIKDVLEKIYCNNSEKSDVKKYFFQASLFKLSKFKNYVEIGSNRGRSLFSVSFAVSEAEGKAYSIDPYLPQYYNYTLTTELDLEEVFNQVQYFKNKFELDSTVKTIRKLPHLAIKEFYDTNIGIDMLRIDGNFNMSMIKDDIVSYISLVDDNGIIVLDDFDKKYFDEIYNNNKEKCKLIYKDDSYYVLLKQDNNIESVDNKNKINEIIEEIVEYYKKFIQHKLMDDLVIMDDFFPHYNSPFRYGEFNEYLKEFKNIKIYANGNSIHLIENKKILEIVKEYKKKEPKFSDKVIAWSGGEFPETLRAKVAYFCFLQNVFYSLDSLEKNNIPFVFELYPGGGLALNDDECDERLKKVFDSPFFRKVIVTQKVTKDYLINKKLCKEDKIEFIFGGVIPKQKLYSKELDKKFFGINKNTLDICFVANRYTKYGKDKGYDIFIEVAKKLCEKYSNIVFHVVGDFDENVIDISCIKDRIIFYGVKDYDWFDSFYLDKDIILSPTKNGFIKKGSFDGFPTTACIDASLKETTIFTTCEFDIGDNLFEDDKNIVIVKHNVNDVIEKIEKYYKNPNDLRKVALLGRKTCLRLFSYESQIKNRINIIKKEIESYENKIELSLEAYKNKIKKFNNDYIELRQGYINLENGYNNLNKGYLDTQNAYNNLERGYIALENNCKHLCNENNRLREVYKTLDVQHNKLLNKYKDATIEHSKFRAKIEKTMWWKLIGKWILNKK